MGTQNTKFQSYINGLVQERRHSSALAMELCLSCTNPLIRNVAWHICGLHGTKRLWLIMCHNLVITPQIWPPIQMASCSVVHSSQGDTDLTHWGWVTHICVSKLIIIGSDNSLSPCRRQAIICTNAGILLNGPLWTNFSEISTEIYTLLFKKMHLKMLPAKLQPFYLGLIVLRKQLLPWQPADNPSHGYHGNTSKCWTC